MSGLSKRWVWIMAALLITSVVAALLARQRASTSDQNTQTQDSPMSKTTDAGSDERLTLVIGSDSAEFTFTEYVDYKCPSCARFHQQAWPEIKKKFINSGKAKLLVRNLPFIGPDSRRAAEGSYCAKEQGSFEQYHDAVYDFTSKTYSREGTGKEFEDILSIDLLASFVSEAGGNGSEFKTCVNENRHALLVDADLRASENDNARGTPTFIIGAQRITGPQPASVLIPIIEANL
jgi:protein-disulfide isomerase